jgi:hypothetical protein
VRRQEVRENAIIVLKEFDPREAGSPLFASVGMPRVLEPDWFGPATLQRTSPGQAGLQRFFQEGGRAFCIYVVLGGYARRDDVVPAVNSVLATIRIDPAGAQSGGTPGAAPGVPSTPATTAPSTNGPGAPSTTTTPGDTDPGSTTTDTTTTTTGTGATGTGTTGTGTTGPPTAGGAPR